jgi:hypothetical protein
MATTAGRGILALSVAAILLAIGTVLAVMVDPFAREQMTVDPATEWIARVLLALGVVWLLIGAVAARTRLVRRPGAAAARASWIASTLRARMPRPAVVAMSLRYPSDSGLPTGQR